MNDELRSFTYRDGDRVLPKPRAGQRRSDHPFQESPNRVASDCVVCGMPRAAHTSGG